MFKLFESKENEQNHFMELICEEDYTSIIDKMNNGFKMNSEEERLFDLNIVNRIQTDGVVFLSDLFKEGYDISDDWLLQWTKTKKFVINYNLPVYGSNYFKERLEKIAPDILSYYLYRMDNLSMSVARSYRSHFLQTVEILTSVRNYTKIIEHIQTGISDKNLSEYVQKLKTLNEIVENNPSFYDELDSTVKVSDYLKDLEKIIEYRNIQSKKPNIKNNKEFELPLPAQEYIRRIYENHAKCIENENYLKEETVDLLDKIKRERMSKLVNKFKDDANMNDFLNELRKIDSAISSVLVGINKQKMSEGAKDTFLFKPRKR